MAASTTDRTFLTKASTMNVEEILTSSIRTHCSNNDCSLDSYQQLLLPDLTGNHRQILTKGIEAIVHQAALKARKRSYDTLVLQRLANQHEEKRRSDMTMSTNENDVIEKRLESNEGGFNFTPPSLPRDEKICTNSSIDEGERLNSVKDKGSKNAGENGQPKGGKKTKRWKRDRHGKKNSSQLRTVDISCYSNPVQSSYLLNGGGLGRFAGTETTALIHMEQHPPYSSKQNSVKTAAVPSRNQNLYLGNALAYHHQQYYNHVQLQPGDFNHETRPPYNAMPQGIHMHQQYDSQQAYSLGEIQHDSQSRGSRSRGGDTNKSRSKSRSYDKGSHHRPSRRSVRSRSWSESRRRSKRRRYRRYEHRRSSEHKSRYSRSYRSRRHESRRGRGKSSRRRSESISSSGSSYRRTGRRRRSRSSSTTSSTSTSSRRRGDRYEHRIRSRKETQRSQSDSEGSRRLQCKEDQSRALSIYLDDAQSHSMKTIDVKKKSRYIATPSTMECFSTTKINDTFMTPGLQSSKKCKNIDSQYEYDSKEDSNEELDPNRNENTWMPEREQDKEEDNPHNKEDKNDIGSKFFDRGHSNQASSHRGTSFEKSKKHKCRSKTNLENKTTKNSSSPTRNASKERDRDRSRRKNRR